MWGMVYPTVVSIPFTVVFVVAIPPPVAPTVPPSIHPGRPAVAPVSPYIPPGIAIPGHWDTPGHRTASKAGQNTDLQVVLLHLLFL